MSSPINKHYYITFLDHLFGDPDLSDERIAETIGVLGEDAIMPLARILVKNRRSVCIKVLTLGVTMVLVELIFANPWNFHKQHILTTDGAVNAIFLLAAMSIIAWIYIPAINQFQVRRTASELRSQYLHDPKP